MLHPDAYKFTQVMRLLDSEGMSGNEDDFDDENQPIFLRTRVEWRSEQLTKVLETLDLLHISTKFQATGERNPGRWPTPRVASEVDERYDRGAPSHLPKNFYDQQWLDTLTEDELFVLAVEKPVDLTISTKLEKYAIPIE